MGKKLFHLLAAGILPFFLQAVSLEQNGDSFRIIAKNYIVSLNKATGYSLRIEQVGKTKIHAGNAVPSTEMDSDWEKYRGSYNPPPYVPNRNQMKPEYKVISSSPEEITLGISWNFPGGVQKETITFRDSPVISYAVSLDHTARVYAHKFRISVSRCGNDGIFLPDGFRPRGVWHGNGELLSGAGWRCAWYPGKKIAVGAAVAPADHLRGVEYYMQGSGEGFSGETAGITLVYGAMSNSGKAGTKDFRYHLLLTDDPAALRAEAEKICGKPKNLEIFSCETEKLITLPGDPNTLAVQVRNNGTVTERAVLKTRMVYGLNSKASLPEVKFSLEPGEKKTLRIPLKFPEGLRKGTAVIAELADSSGKIVDRNVDFCTVSDFCVRDAMVGVVNAAQANQDGSEDIWSGCFKKKYVGTFNYYCWMHSALFGLVPKTEKWVPRTEANYTTPISKTFLKGMIASAHKRGINVFSMLTGLWNYQAALEHPEWMQYYKDGQPCLYNGSISEDGTRRAIVKSNPYTEERAAIWGNEFADCIDEFGFDGCRWDWNFIPNINNDPLLSDDEKEEWYDINGVPQSKLYPDPDETAQKALSAWRKAVNKRHPRMIYGVNCGSSDETVRTYPKYFKELSTHSLVLFESMLGYADKKYNTFEKWGTELALRCDKVRTNGGAPIVGWMRGTNIGTVAFDLANYVSSSAGVKWFQGFLLRQMGDESVRNRYFLRFAEYYYSCDFLLSKEHGITQTGNEKVLWKPFVRERRLKDGTREIVMPLVNMPKDDFICQYHDAPEIRNGLTFSVRPGAGEKIESVWLMTPQKPEEAVELPVAGNQFRIDGLRNAAMVLIRLKGK